jgi:hypothetical protein
MRREALIVGAWSVVLGAGALPAQQPSPLARRYREGDSLHYRMDATNQNRDRVLKYSASTDGVVRRDSLGRFVEDFEWSHLVRNDSAISLPAGAPTVRQRLTLAPEFIIPPNVPKIHPALPGPVLDLFTFYADLWISAKMPLAHAGDHARLPGTSANSWADGQTLIVAEDAIDFEMTLTAVDTVARVARLEVRHVPTAEPHVRLSADWMKVPLFDKPNNWVEVTRGEHGSYTAAVGRETFDVRLVVSLTDGRILSATMDNPVDVLERTCSDAALTSCSPPTRYKILRTIALR